MILENVWVVTDGQGNYFAGFRQSQTTGQQVSVFEPLSSETRCYKSKKAAASAIRMAQSCYESPYLEATFIERIECSDKPKRDELQRVPEEEQNGWECLDRLCGKFPAIIKKNDRLGIVLANKLMYYLPSNERFAWKRYFRECEDFVISRIDSRAKKQP